MAIGAMLAVFVWLLPAMVARGPLLNWIVGSVGELKGKVTARSASLGWFSPSSLFGVEVRDEQGQLLLEIPNLQSDRSLLALLWDASDLGRVRLEKPKLHAVLRDGGSNVEDVLASYLAPRKKRRAGVSLGLEVVDGSVSVSESQTQQTWQIEDLQLALSVPADAAAPLELQTSGTLADPQRPGQLSVELKLHRGRRNGHASADTSAHGSPAEGQKPDVSNELAIQTDGLSLAVFKPVLDRFWPSARLAGRLSSSVRCQWDKQGGSGRIAVDGVATAEDLKLAAPPLGKDQLELRHVDVTCRAAWEDEQVRVDQLSAESDLGDFSLLGTLDLRDKSAGKMLVWLPKQRFEIDGRIDLAGLAAVLPRTLRIREGTEVTSGELQLALSSRRGAQGMNWHARITTGNLTATDRGREMVWEQPILMTLAAHEGPDGPIVESLQCESDFVKIHAAGTRSQLAASASFDLNRLSGQLGKFVDLSGVSMAGDGWAQLHWQHADQESFQAEGELRVRDFELALANRPRWAEDDLTVTLSASGRTDFAADTQVDAASLTLQAGSDRLEARLMQPVLDLREGGVWPVEIRSEGELARWQPRLRPWIRSDHWKLAGAHDLFAQVIGSAGAIHVRRARVAVERFQLQGPGFRARQPQVELSVCGSWDRRKRRLELPSATFTGSSISARATDVVCTLPRAGSPQLAGTVTYQGSLDRLQDLTLDVTEPPQWQLVGGFSGRAEIQHSAGITTGGVETTINNLVATHRSGRRFQEPQIRLVAHGSYDDQSRSLQLEQAQLSSGALAVQAAGQIAPDDDQTQVRLAGQVDYDLEQISELLGPYTGDGVHLAGRGTSPVSYQGPLRLDVAQAEAAAGWQRADVYGFQVGPGEVRARLCGGLLQVQPLELDVSEGRLQLSPQLQVERVPVRPEGDQLHVELYVEPGRLVDHVRINPTMCRRALQYIAPVLAGVAVAEGTFSIELDACRIPLSDPGEGKLAGRMTIHSVQIGPGPLTQELALLLGRASPAQLTRESVISFHMADRRIHHRGLELAFPNVTVRTSGSVGLKDQSLDITAEMPIPPKLLANRPLLDSALRNQTIRVPIGGTLSRPRIDPKALQELSRQFLEDAARNLLEDGLNRGLQRLLNRPR